MSALDDELAAVINEPTATEQLHDELVHHELRRLRARDAAQALYAAERAGRAEPFDLDTLAGVLARPAPPPGRVLGLIPWEASTLVVAQRKTGKTTLLLNLARCLLSGDPFLGRFEVRKVRGRVALLNYEVSGHTLAQWAHEAGLPHERLVLANLRGRRNPLGSPDDRTALAEQLRALDVETLLVDPFGRAYTGANQNDAGEVGAWLVELDRFARSEVGARDLVLAVHAGWNGERTRGTSALEDWADSIVTLTRDEDSGARFLRALGRDVELDEDRLDFDEATRTLSLSGAGGRKTIAQDRRHDDLADAIVGLVEATPGLNTSQLQEALRANGHGVQRGDTGRVARALVEAGRLATVSGPRGANLYFPPDLSRPIPTCPENTSPPIPTRPYRDGMGGGHLDTAPIPTCSVCSQALDPVHVEAGTHPGCDAMGAA